MYTRFHFDGFVNIHELLYDFTPGNENETFPIWKRGIEGDFSAGRLPRDLLAALPLSPFQFLYRDDEVRQARGRNLKAVMGLDLHPTLTSHCLP